MSGVTITTRSKFRNCNRSRSSSAVAGGGVEWRSRDIGNSSGLPITWTCVSQAPRGTSKATDVFGLGPVANARLGRVVTTHRPLRPATTERRVSMRPSQRWRSLPVLASSKWGCDDTIGQQHGGKFGSSSWSIIAPCTVRKGIGRERWSVVPSETCRCASVWFPGCLHPRCWAFKRGVAIDQQLVHAKAGHNPVSAA